MDVCCSCLVFFTKCVIFYSNWFAKIAFMLIVFLLIPSECRMLGWPVLQKFKLQSALASLALSRFLPLRWSRDSSAGIATRYGLGGPGIESRWGRDFHLSRLALRPTQPPTQRVPGLPPGVKQPGRGVDHPPSFSAEVKERVELFLYSPSGPSWPVLG